jgi:hypothetical protein
MGGVDQTKRICPNILLAGSNMKRYRLAAKQWLQVFQSFGCVVQKKSIDEALLDLTDLVRARLNAGDIRTSVPHPDPSAIVKERDLRMEHARQALEAVRTSEVWGDEEEASGTMRAAIMSSRSTDPLTTMQDSYRFARIPTAAQASSLPQHAPLSAKQRSKQQYVSYAEVYTDAKLTPEQNRVRALTPEQFDAHMKQIHCIDHCRASRSQLEPIALVPATLPSSLLSLSHVHDNCDSMSSSSISTESDSSSSSLDDLVSLLGPSPPSPRAVAPSIPPLDCWLGTVVCANDYSPPSSTDLVAAVTAYNNNNNNDSSTNTALPATSMASMDDVLLCIGAQIAFEIRRALFSQYGLTTSAGIANSPMLAKIASSTNKPNQQSIVRPCIGPLLLNPLSIRKIPGFGAKSQSIVSAKGLDIIGQLQHHTLSELSAAYGEVSCYRLSLCCSLNHMALSSYQ